MAPRNGQTTRPYGRTAVFVAVVTHPLSTHPTMAFITAVCLALARLAVSGPDGASTHQYLTCVDSPLRLVYSGDRCSVDHGVGSAVQPFMALEHRYKQDQVA